MKQERAGPSAGPFFLAPSHSAAAPSIPEISTLIATERIEAAADVLDAITAGGHISRSAAVAAALTVDDLARMGPPPELADAAAIIRLHPTDQIDLADRGRALYLSLHLRILQA